MRLNSTQITVRGAASMVTILAIGAGVLIPLLMPSPARAHAYGPFSISVYSRLVVGEEQVEIRWVLDMAEVPAAATVELIDANADGSVTEQEKVAYFGIWSGSILDQIELVVDGRSLAKEIVSHELTLPAGEGGSPSLRLVMDLTAELPSAEAGGRHSATYRDANYADYVGWREVAVAAGPGVELISSSAPTEGRTSELTVYPADLGLSVPTSNADFTFALTGLRTADQVQSSAADESAANATGFQLWPTGVLAGLALVGLIVVMVIANQPGRRADR